jgi:ABC-type dipeptide/oligopeptide/nickel transport system permease component
MKYLITALVFGVFSTILITYLIMMIPFKNRKPVKLAMFTFESFPDIFVILICQLAIIWIYQYTGVAVFNIADTYGDRAFVMPVLVLSFLPTIYMVKYLLIRMEEEETALYVELAKGKGLSKSTILLKHVFRNAIFTLIHQFKSIFWFSLSNLLMLEIIFAIDGFMTFIVDHIVRNPEIMTISLLLVFLPYAFISLFGKIILFKVLDREGV